MGGLAKRGAIRTARKRIGLLDPKVLMAEFLCPVDSSWETCPSCWIPWLPSLSTF